MYEAVDELGMTEGKRYVSAAICVCAEHAARAHAATDHSDEPADASLVLAPFEGPVSIIPPEVLAQQDASNAHSGIQPKSDQHSLPDQDITSGMLQRFCSVKGATTLIEQVQGPANTLLVHGWGARAFSMFLWWLLPTETPDRYAIKNPDPVYNIGNGIPPPTHVAFADHSASARLSLGALSRRALAKVLHPSGAMDTFEILRHCSREGGVVSCEDALCLAGTGSAFRRSVVEYEGPEACLEVGLWEAAEALALKQSACPQAGV
ncbi:hypothetical protein GSI_12361 [Ganoderma sinense ZZ0214-1]|uniref:Uncharacterized protein n=1 Tax=Ganoderma sinense ZZ0214-1 TaxID=1077348 RepID=A0A2G8RYK7_9APHY|nr:hypothetical protein GSI_12361 [Ganoderma sinense ZZ0214-1]